MKKYLKKIKDEDNKNLNKRLLIQLVKINNTISKNNLIDLLEVLGDKSKFMKRNFIAGILKGLGGGIGFYLITALLIYILQKIIKLNIPIISEYIADIIDIINKSKNGII